MNPEQHMERAFKRLEVARLNLASGYPDDSCNRSYYATFEAASAALAVLGISPPKTHKGVAKLFQQHVVKPGRVDTKTGAVISRIERLRLIADYEGVPIEMEQAHDALQQAEKFVEVIRAEFLPGFSPGPKKTPETVKDYKAGL
jgi:uncharacterized protein (UPF0332 family)